ncbi:hypothetical protein AB0J65_15555, partial [Streptomyces toxytricini]
MSGVVVDAYATGLLSTTVTALPDGSHRWLRRPGAGAPQAFAPLTAGLRELVEEASPGPGARLLTGDPAPDGARAYAAPGPYSVAHWLITGGGPHAVPGGHSALTATLREVGALPVPPAGPGPRAPGGRPGRTARRHRR